MVTSGLSGTEVPKKLLKKIGKLRYNVLFVEGCHENYDLLEQYEVSEWCGGKTRLISGRLRQLMRGQVYEIAGKKVFSFGGGQSDDSYDLVEGQNWWAREIPSEEELAEGIRNLEKAGNCVDFVVTYEPPSGLHDFLDRSGAEERNHINTYLNGIFEKITFNGWYFGKLHLNKLIPPKYNAVYDGITAADKNVTQKPVSEKQRDEEKEN